MPSEQQNEARQRSSIRRPILVEDDEHKSFQKSPVRKFGLVQKAKLTLEIRNTLMKKASWKTTLGGIMAASGPAAKMALPPQWSWIGDALLAIGSLIIGASARDNGVTSEQSGAK